MLYFLQTGISEKKHLKKGLQAIYGVGEKTAKNLILQHGILPSTRGKNLRRLHRVLLRADLQDYPCKLGADLKYIYKINCQRLIQIVSYRGRRHKAGYPLRGQRTHTNAKTQKRLYRRWSTITYEKPKFIVSKKTTNNIKKAGKPKKTVQKVKTKQKAKVVKSSKYKI